ncbi:MAG: bifunctional folylpolyglutamate synthase/dihydrofolate synthase [Geopsychrobacter sp.]|nr:bifunctional folylpolyglutamate synthase/dihydrofolate synthase [Geopsychrobacter sp.]
MDYSSSLEYLYALQQFGIKLGLENTHRLLNALNNPQRMLRIVHIAGTNGKGSTAAALEQLFRSQGFRTGLYTSPHLHSFTERIRINNRPISEAQVVRQIREIRSHSSSISPTFFEFTTVMALRVFAEQQVDWVILETGLGGRLDATNVVRPELCIITPVALDHAAHLGESLAQIAAEKGGIIKQGVPVVSARQDPQVLDVLQRLAADKTAPLLRAAVDFKWSLPPNNFDFFGKSLTLRDMRSTLNGDYQRENISLALAALEQLLPVEALDTDALLNSLLELRWAGRLEWCGEVLLDGAHNPHAASALADYLSSENLDGMLWVLAVKADKDISGIMTPLLPHVEKIFVAPLQDEVAAPCEMLAAVASRQGTLTEIFSSLDLAFKQALAARKEGQKILIAGSLFLVAELRQKCTLRSGVSA